MSVRGSEATEERAQVTGGGAPHLARLDFTQLHEAVPSQAGLSHQISRFLLCLRPNNRCGLLVLFTLWDKHARGVSRKRLLLAALLGITAF